MNFFRDNNVLIGYIFETDNWSSNSLVVMAHNSKKYSSDNVRRECSDIYDKSLRTLKQEFNKLKKEIKASRLFKIENIKSFLYSNAFKITDVIIYFLRDHSYSTPQDALSGLNNLQRTFEARCYGNYLNIDSLVTFHNRISPYKELYEIFKLNGFVAEDPEDVEIVIDAHDLGLSINPLFLISGDYGHIVPRKKFIIENTSLKDVIGLGEFTGKY
jgi:hypothetical protein